MTRADVVAEALTWVGTPFKWQQSLKGEGADCRGLIEGVMRTLGMPEADSPWLRVKDYGGKIPVETLKKGIAQVMRRVPAIEPGDVALLWFKGRPQHMGIFTGEHLIHACVGCRHPQVLATRSAAAFKAWPLHSAWRFPSLED